MTSEITLTPEEISDVTKHNPYLAEARLLAEAIQKLSPDKLHRARAYARTNAETALLEAVTHNMVSRTRQDYREGGFEAFGQPLTTIFAKGLQEITQKHSFELCYGVEKERRELELKEQLYLDQAAKAGELENCVMAVISPYPEKMDPELAKTLGYVPDKKLGTLRLHDFRPEEGSKVTTTLSFTNSPQKSPELSFKLEDMAIKNGGRVEEIDNNELLGRYFLIPKNEAVGGNEISNQVMQALYPEGTSALGYTERIMRQAQPLVDQLVRLDELLGISLLTGKKVRDLQQMIEALPERETVFNEDTAISIKKKALINAYVLLSFLSDQKTVRGLKRPQELNLFDNPELDEAILALEAPLEMAFCGLNLGSVYNYGPDLVRGYLFGLGSHDIIKVTSCPSCHKKWLLRAKHGKHGICCSCGNRVANKQAAKCIVESAKPASPEDKIQLQEAALALQLNQAD